jgi:hypothetical protein
MMARERAGHSFGKGGVIGSIPIGGTSISAAFPIRPASIKRRGRLRHGMVRAGMRKRQLNTNGRTSRRSSYEAAAMPGRGRRRIILYHRLR